MSNAAWEGPPRGVLGHPAVIRQFVARTDRAVVALQHALAFPEGCLLTLHVALRRGSLGSRPGSGCERALPEKALTSRRPTLT